LSLVFPAHASTLYTNPIEIIAFLVTFALVASIWYSHRRIFETYFAPTPLAVILNFAVLASTVLLSFMLQVFLHYRSDLQDFTVAALGYFTTYAITYVLLGALCAAGTRSRWPDLTADQRREGVRKSTRTTLVGIAFVTGLALCNPLRLPIVYAPMFIVPILLASRVAFRFILPRIR
jgi:uncharacterized membrane protein